MLPHSEVARARNGLTGINNPRVTRDILRALGTMLNFKLDLRQFDVTIVEFEAQVAEASAKNPDTSA